MIKDLGALVSEKTVLQQFSFHKYRVEFPHDWEYGMVAKRLFLASLDLLKKGVISTYLVRDKEGLQAWIFTHVALEEELKKVLASKDLALGHYEGEVELNPRENFREFKNLLDVWVNHKLGGVFKYDYDFDAWLVEKLKGEEGREKAVCFTTQVEYTPKGHILLWIDPSVRVRYSLADYINDLLGKMGILYTVQEIGESGDLRGNPAVIRVLEQIFERIMGEFATGEGKTVNLVTFTRDGDKRITKGKVESIIPNWTDRHSIKPQRHDVLLRKRQTKLFDFLKEAEETITLYEYLTKRKMKEKREYHPEYPVIKVKTGRRLLDFTPSDVLIQYRGEKLTIPPKDRYGYFKKIAERIVTETQVDFPFLPEPVRLIHRFPSEFKPMRSNRSRWRIEVKDNSGVKPLPMLQEGGKPLGGALRVHLLYVAPDIDGERADVENLIYNRNELIKRKFAEHNLGEIIGYSVEFYEWVELNVEKTRENIRKTLVRSLRKKLDLPEGVIVFPVVIGPSYRGRYYEDVKREASALGKHSQIILWDNFKDMDEETAATLACDIYVEALIQENIDRLEELDGLVWRLVNPADGKGETVYVGFDYSRDREGRVSGAFALLCDSYGRLISIKHTSLTRDYITEEAARDIFVYALEKAGRYAERKGLKKPKRVVFYRDGSLRPLEREGILRGFDRALRALGIENRLVCLDLVEVIKRHSKRMYSKYKGEISNPWFGEYVVMPVLDGFHDGRALISSTFIDPKIVRRDEVDYTVKPVEVRYATYGSQKSSIGKIVDEYLALTALNFWSPFRRPKLCLPLILAHNLANLMRVGVRPRLPA